jgi:hypothetical protein
LIISGKIINARLFHDLMIYNMVDRFFRQLDKHLADIQLLDKISTMFLHISIRGEKGTIIDILIKEIMALDHQTSLNFFSMLCDMYTDDDFDFVHISPIELPQKIKIMIDSGIHPTFDEDGICLELVLNTMNTSNFENFECLKDLIDEPKSFVNNLAYHRQASLFNFSDLRDIVYPDLLGLIREYVMSPSAE